MGYGYNLDEDGYITAAGLNDFNQYQSTGDEPWLNGDIRRWRYVNGEWVELTQEEFESKFGVEMPE